MLVSQKKELTLNHWNESFLKWIPSRFMLTSTWNISILSAHLLVSSRRSEWKCKFILCSMCHFWSGKNSGFPGSAVHKAALRSQTLLYQALQAWWNENETNQTNHRRLASRKGGVWKNESLSKSFGSRWASKVKINAYYKTMKVFFDLCVWTPKTKIWTFHYP